MNNDFQPGELFNKFQAKKKKAAEKKKKSSLKMPSVKGSSMSKGLGWGSSGSKGSGWGGQKPLRMKKGKKKSHKKHKNWIAGAIKHPGALHRELGVAKGKKIPEGKLRAAAKKGGKEGKRARLAETLKSFHKGKKKKMSAKNDHDADDKKKKTMCKKHKKAMCKMCGK